MAFPSGWGRKCKLTIQNVKVPGSLTDFPALLTLATLPSEMFDADGSYPALNGGGDIRFSSDAAGAIQLACEVVTFVTNNDPALGSAEIWVKVPSVASTTDTDFYVWYNKAGETQPAETDTYGKHNAWDSNFKLVQHMSQDPSGTAPQMIDSTVNSNDGTSGGTMTSSDLVAAKVGNGLDFDGTNDLINCGNGASIDSLETMTVSAWFKTDIIPGAGIYPHIICQRNTSQRIWHLYLDGGDLGRAVYVLGYSTTSADARTAWTPTINIWYHFCAIFSSVDKIPHIFINGSEGAYDTQITGVGTVVLNNTIDVLIGNRVGSDRTWDGLLDEVRISNVVRSADWITAEYNNQNDPGTFIVEGTPESTGTGSGNFFLMF